METVTEHK
jgi:hypothetical protein